MVKIWSSLNMRPKLTLLFLLVGLVPLLIATWWSAQLADQALMNRAMSQLESSLHTRKILVEQYFMERWGDLTVLSTDPDTLLAMENFATAFQEGGIEGTAWQAVHGRFGAWLTLFRDTYHYHDLLFIDSRGQVVFSVAREGDLGQNVLNGSLANTSLGKVLTRSLNQKMAIHDFESYTPSRNQESAFLATALNRGDKRIGTMILQIAVTQLDDLMAQAMTSESRETSLEHAYLVGRAGGRIQARGRVPAHAMHLLHSGGHQAANEAMAGKSGTLLLADEPDHRRLVAFSPLAIDGLEWAVLGEIPLQEVRAPVNTLVFSLLGISAVLAVVMLLTAMGSARHFTQPVMALMAVAERLGAGEWHARATLQGSGELVRLGETINRMGGKIQNQFWIKEGVAQLSRQLQQADAPAPFADTLIQFLTSYVGAVHGMLLLRDEAQGCYQPTGRHRWQAGTSPCFHPGEGLVGRAAREKQLIVLTGLEEHAITLTSGLTMLHPAHLLLLPLVVGERVLGVVELVSHLPFDEPRLTLLEEVATLAGLILDNLERKQITENLLIASQRQAEELAAQTEELQSQQESLYQANVELMRQSQELEASEETLRKQQESLHAMNEELEEKNLALQHQKSVLEQARRQVELASRYKSEFLANMSHELRTPLNSLLILAKSLHDNSDGNLTPGQVEAAGIIHDSGSDLLLLINEILDLSKIEAGRMTVHADTVSLVELAEEIRRRFRPVAQEKGLTFQIHLADNLPTTLVTDQEKVKRILGNFLSNAFKFTPRGEVAVHFTHLADQNRLAITVADSGIGIPADEMETIFEAFKQLDSASNRRFAGTGLGLTIARRLAGLIGADITSESQVEQGSRFTLLLPVTPAPAADSQPSPLPRLAAQLPLADDREAIQNNDRTLLIIEDDPHFARIVRDQARKNGFKCLIARDAASGLALASSHHPTGIVLDLGLPDAHGYSVLVQLKERAATRHIPVHILSGLQQDLESRKLGAIGHLTKPVDAEGIELALARIGRFATATPRSLLLVEDDPHAQTAITQLVKGRDIKVTTVSRGMEALDQLQQHPFDCMVLDLGLPDISGFELLERLASHQELTKPPVIIYSGRELSREEYARLKAHTDSIVVKSARSQERLLDEVVLFLHRVEQDLSDKQRQLIRRAHDVETLLAGRKVLVVDDDMRGAYALARSLEEKQMQVTMAAHGKRALEILDQQPDMEMVLMDVMMPEMDGYEAIRHIRNQERFARLPIIALTAKAMQGDREKCLAAGASDYLPKPVEINRLLSMLRIWLFA